MALTNKQQKELAKLESIADEERSDAQAVRYAELLDMQAESLGDDNISVDEVESSGNNNVYVFANLQNKQSFRLGSKIVTIDGMPVSKLVTPGGGFFAGGKYGVTSVPADDWKEVLRLYGRMRMFQTGIVFAAKSIEEGKAITKDYIDVRHGFEQIDPNSKRVKSTPKTED